MNDSNPSQPCLFNPKLDRRLILGALALAALLRVAVINRHGLWNNEFITFNVIRLHPMELIKDRLRLNHMPLYFLAEKAWVAVFGASGASLRAIGVFFGVLAVWATARLARRLGGTRLAVPVVFAAAIHQMWMQNSVEARMYSVLTWSAAESMDAYLGWARDEGSARSNLARWVLVSAFGFMNHMFFAAVFLSQVTHGVVMSATRRRPAREFLSALAAALLLCVPLVVLWMANQQTVMKEHHWSWDKPLILARQTIRMYWGDYDSINWRPLDALPGVAMFIALAGLALELRPRRGASAKPGCGFLLVGYLAWLAAIYVGAARTDAPVLGVERYYIMFGPSIVVFAWAGLLRLAEIWPRPIFVLGALILLLEAAYTVAYYAGRGEGIRESVAAIEADLPEGRGFVGVTASSAWTGLGDYYGPKLMGVRKLIPRDDRTETDIEAALDPYTRARREFWVLTYHEKKNLIWSYLEKRPNLYQPAGQRQVIGKTAFQLYRRID